MCSVVQCMCHGFGQSVPANHVAYHNAMFRLFLGYQQRTRININNVTSASMHNWKKLNGKIIDAIAMTHHRAISHSDFVDTTNTCPANGNRDSSKDVVLLLCIKCHAYHTCECIRLLHCACIWFLLPQR